MISLLDLCVWVSLSLSVSVLAKDASTYNPAMPFRPDNVTGLNGVYHWVGSYYNATTEIELRPTIGRTPNDSVCDALRNKSFTRKWNSVLAITERGPYNIGSNPVNMWLNMIQPNTSWSNIVWKDTFRDAPSSLLWPMISSNPLARNWTTVGDNFNMTVWRPHPPAFSFRGVMRPQSRLSDDASRSINNISLPACNATSQNGDWILMLHTLDWPYWLGDWHGFTRPMMVGAFDEHTANLTIVGKFTAYPWLWPNASRYNLGNNHAVSGDIHIRFRGVLDPYHSDVLDVNSSSPAWLRTVGFGNDSRNIGYGEKNSGARLGVGLGFVSIASLVALLGMMVGM